MAKHKFADSLDDGPKIGRDGRVPKKLGPVPTTPGMRSRISHVDTRTGLVDRVIDDEPIAKSYVGKTAPIHKATPARNDRGAVRRGVSKLTHKA